MLLRHWFQRNATLPIAAALSVLTLASMALAWNHIQAVQQTQQSGLQQVSSLAALSLTQRNRPLLEAALDATRWQLGSISATVCQDSRIIASSSLHGSTCDSPTVGMWHRILEAPVSGFEGYRLILVLPLLGTERTWILGLVLAAAAMIFSGGALLWMKRRVSTDLLLPLEEGFASNRPIPIAELERLRQAQLEATRAKVRGAVAEALIRRDRQIAHDIRSPLAALGAILSTIPGMDEEQRSLTRTALGRIRGIASELSHVNLQSEVPSRKRPYHLLQGILQVIEEQRARLVGRPEVTIINPGQEAYGLCANLDPVEFQRAVSNLLDNAVDATSSQGIIRVELRRGDSHIELTISDQGKGISAELLPRLGTLGATFGKSHGSGLGLFHAREMARSSGGDLSIASELGKGTTVTLKLVASERPATLPEILRISAYDEVLVIDDDPTVHQQWKAVIDGPFRALDRVPEGTALLDGKKRLILVDHDFRGSAVTGLDWIEKHSFARDAVLVTHRADEPGTEERCHALGLRLLSKNLLSYVPTVG